ncbi:coproporphyrinogen III oxidase family protein [Candidatus Daviesbacteria bacterium]|nr:coproporphyrinogen III oxidase family protein [Candidatus Daviesbacteria bacterium]
MNERDSILVLKAAESIQTLSLQRVKDAGIWRDRSTYFLNIAYPSLQAMREVSAQEVTSASSSKDGRSLALYIHIPFCTAECYYCHYYKQFAQSSKSVDRFLDGIDQELEMHKKRFGGLEVASIYVGGGTPSYLKPRQIDRLFAMIKSHAVLPPGIEISFEMHPESTNDDRLAILRGHGVNRVNIGVESFNNNILAGENRRHTMEDALVAFDRVQKAGIRSINLDLIYGLRGQTVPIWEQNLDEVARLRPASVAMYFLRLKKGTPEYNLWKKDPSTFPTDYDLLLMHAMSCERMEGELEYTQNPVDWFIRDPSFFHQYQDHNWRRSDETELLGVGPSAYSYVGGWQYYNANDTLRWEAILKRGELPIWRGEFLSGDEKMRRTVMLGIKMGIDRPVFKSTYGIDVLDAFPDTWERLAILGFVEAGSDSVDLTYTGKLFADEVGQQFYSDIMKRRMAAIDPVLVSTTWPKFNP